MQSLINVSVFLGIYDLVKSLNEQMTIYSIGSLFLAPTMNIAIPFRKNSTGFQIHLLKIVRFEFEVFSSLLED